MVKAHANRGNRLIEHCLRNILRLTSREFCLDIFKDIQPGDMREIGTCDFTVLPGCTLLQKDHHQGMNRLHLTGPPAWCFGGAFHTYFPFPDTAYARRLVQPVGARDPFTRRALERSGIKARLIGCPTMFCGEAVEWRSGDGPVVFNFGRRSLGAQRRLYDQVRRFSPVRVVIQEERQRASFPTDAEFVDFLDPGRVIEEYTGASVVVTGRLHGAVPALACGTSVVFTQFLPDSRMSLLGHIGLKLHNPYDPRLPGLVRDLKEGRRRGPREILVKLNSLKSAFLEYVEEFWAKVNAL